ncbi:MAG: acetyl-CoA carboxylase biotin carboxylase subunit [Spirochaetia bacterium]
MISSILIANRGEIAVRIIRTCKEMGIRSVAVYSEADKESLHVKMADRAVCIGPPSSKDSYLRMENIVSAAVLSGCDAVHPGVGFLAENARFARIVKQAGLIFIGPEPEVIDRLGDKVEAKRTAKAAGVPVIPGAEGSIEDEDQALEDAQAIGFPVIVKAAAGGGGKGMRIVNKKEDFIRTLKTAAHEAEMAFSDSTVYLEKYIVNPRHVELQILADAEGNVIHLGERDCSVQRNHQKLIEESPSPGVSTEMRQSMGENAVQLFRDLKYTGAGTIEFLVYEGNYYFMEVNARVQVEHPVTEMVTGVDIIKEQIRVASGLKLEVEQKDVRLDGYAIECRINATTPGKVTNYLPPAGYNVRIDSFLYPGCTVPPFYDSLVGKVIVKGADRKEGLSRMQRALDELIIEGIRVNREEQMEIISHPVFVKGDFGTNVLGSIFKKDKK